MLNLEKLISNLHHKTNWVGIREVKETRKPLICRNGKFDHCYTLIDHGCMVEALVDGQFAYYATNLLSPQGLQEACV